MITVFVIARDDPLRPKIIAKIDATKKDPTDGVLDAIKGQRTYQKFSIGVQKNGGEINFANDVFWAGPGVPLRKDPTFLLLIERTRELDVRSVR